MRKLLSILASVGLVATASTSVVACSNSNGANNPSHSYKDLTSWINDSKTNNRTDLVFVGGRKDSDSLSWLAAREYAATGTVNTFDISLLTSKSHVDDIDAKFGDFNNWTANNANKEAGIAIDSVVKLASAQDDPNAIPKTGIINNFWGKTVDGNKTTDPYKGTLVLHSILVDDTSTFFKSGVGLDFCNKFVKEQAKQWNKFYHDEKGKYVPAPKNKKHKKDNPEVDTVVKGIKSSLQQLTGPFFLVFNNGQLAGITNGFKNYTEFNSDMKKNTDETGSVAKSAANDIEAEFKYINTNIWQNIGPYISDNWYPSGTFKSLDYANSSIPQWGNVSNKNKKYSADDSNSDNSGSKDTPKKSYKLDVNKYID